MTALAALTDEQRLALIEEALLEPYDPSTKLACIRLLATAGADARPVPPPAEAPGVPPPPPRAKARRAVKEKPPDRPRKGREDNMSARLLALLADGNEKHTKDLVRLTGKSYGAVSGMLTLMTKRGQVKRTKPGVYQLA